MDYDLITSAARMGVTVRRTRLNHAWSYTDGRSIVWLDHRLTTVEARCALAHELVHIEMGHTTSQPVAVEARVCAETARRLIPLAALGRWCGSDADPWDVAEQLGVTFEVLRDRIETITDVERETLHAARRGHMAPQGQDP